MNIILITPDDLPENSRRVRLSGRRFRHVRDVLRAEPGQMLAVGMLNGGTGSGRVIRIGSDAVEMDLALDSDPPAALPLLLVLALPRPKALRRVLRSVASLGAKRIVLVNAARVEKSYWQTPFLEEARIREQLLLGLEQAGDTVLPEVLLRRRFRPFVEDELPRMAAESALLAAHPGGDLSCPRGVSGPVTLAVGPEGGFVPFELNMLRERGFSAVSLGDRVLGVETAVTALISRLF